MKVYVGICALIVTLLATVHAQVPSNSLTPAQCAVLKTDITADATLNTARTNRQDDVIATAYNAAASPTYWVFRHNVSKGEILFTKSVDNTSFTFVNTGYIGRSQGERDAFDVLFDVNRQTNCGLPNVVQAFVDIFSGAATEAVANRQHLAAICRKAASRMEKLFASNVGLPATCTGGTAASPNGPCVMGFVGPVTTQHIACALNLP